MDLPLQEFNLWVRNLKIEWLIPASVFLSFVSSLMPLLRDGAGLPRLWTGIPKWGCAVARELLSRGCCSGSGCSLSVCWRQVITVFNGRLVCACQGFRCWWHSTEWHRHHPSLLELVLYPVGVLRNGKMCPEGTEAWPPASYSGLTPVCSPSVRFTESAVG